MKSIRTTPAVHAAEGDERIRTAARWLSALLAYVCRGERIDPSSQRVVKFLPNSPPVKGDVLLVDGVRYRVTRSRITWDGARWTIRDLRGVLDA